MIRPAQVTLSQAAVRTRQSVASIEEALRSGDLRSLALRDLDAWRRAVLARTVAGSDR